MKQHSGQGLTDGASSVTGDSVQTPSTSVTTTVPRGPNLIKDADPRHGERFIIVERSTEMALAIVDGEPELQVCDGTETFGIQWHLHWECVLNDGWLGLRNRVTGKYLGYGIEICPAVTIVQNTAIDHAVFERFHASRSSDGGHILYAPYHSEFRLVTVGESTGVLKLEMTETEEGTKWQFIKVVE